MTMAECLAVSNKTVLSKQAFQSLLGKLIYIQKCVKPSRIFINRILHLFRSNSHLRKTHLIPDFHKDIQWFLEFLPSFHGISYIHKPRVNDSQSLFLDACLTGMGAVSNNFWHLVNSLPLLLYSSIKLSLIILSLIQQFGMLLGKSLIT